MWVAAVAEASLRLVPVLGVVLVAARLPGSRVPRARWVALLAALTAALTLPFLSALAVRWPVEVPVPGVPTALARAAQSAGEAGLSSLPTVQGRGILRAAAWIWTLGTLALLVRLGAGAYRLRRLREAAIPLLRRTTPEAAAPRPLVSRGVHAPMTFGLLHPVIVLPEDARRWAPELLQAVLAHEGAHVRAHDAWARLLAGVATAVHWPNPLVWLAARACRDAAEEGCDDAVVRSGVSAETYAETLLQLARSRGEGGFGTLAAKAGAHGLERRLARILGRAPVRPMARAVPPALACAVLGLAGLAGVLEPVPTHGPPPDAVHPAAAREAARFDIDEHLARRIVEAAMAEGIDIDLGFGLVSVESGFRMERVSARGAVGLVQIIPDAAAAVAPDTSPEALLDPDVNLRVGFRLLRTHLAHFGGDRRRALVAYHAGARAAEQLRDGLDSPSLGYARAVLRETR